MTASDVLKILHKQASTKRANINAWFFKTGKGQYGEGDKFLGLSVPQIRSILKQFKNIDLAEISLLLENPYHEVRLFALLALVKQYPSNPEKIYNLYMTKIKYINNWDLVDLSAPYIVGPYLENKSKDILFKLAKSRILWERRISILSTFYYIKTQKPEIALEIAEILINDKHDLIQKAVGWMLREIGKRCSIDIEEKFLDQYAPTMPRTALRYALEHFPGNKRLHYMEMKYKFKSKPLNT